MHAPSGRAICGILMVAMVVTLGCRGANPFGRYVQVTESTDGDVPSIDAPPQRLLTTKPRSPDDSPSGQGYSRVSSSKTSLAGDPTESSVTQRGPIASNAQTTAGQVQTTAGQVQTEQKTVSTRLPSKSSASASDQSVTASYSDGPRAAGAEGQQPTVSATSQVQDSTTKGPLPGLPPTPRLGEDVMSDELLAALQDFPPELRQQALRQFVAAAARRAGQTSQPNTLSDALAKNVHNLPTLPEPKTTVPEISPQRIAADDREDEPMFALSDTAALSLPKQDFGASASLSDSQAGDLESVEVQTVAQSMVSDTGAVQTASAARDPNEGPMVSRAAVADASTATQAVAASQPMGSATTAPPKSENELIAELVTRLSNAAPDESEAERSSRLIKLRHLMVLNGDPDAAVASIEGMADAEQEYLRHHLLGLWTMIDPQGHPVPSRRFTTAIPQFREAAKFAAAATDSLEVRSLAFCTEIESYGQITTFSGNRFKPGQQVILYCEVENFTVKKLEQGYETHLQGSYDIYNSKNEKVLSQVLPADQQVSANYLRDYFIAYQMYLPSELLTGTYRLQLTMEDAHGKKYGQASIPFEMAK